MFTIPQISNIREVPSVFYKAIVIIQYQSQVFNYLCLLENLIAKLCKLY